MQTALESVLLSRNLTKKASPAKISPFGKGNTLHPDVDFAKLFPSIFGKIPPRQAEP
jgi:hypothetical protein